MNWDPVAGLNSFLATHPDVHDGIALLRRTEHGDEEAVLYLVPEGRPDLAAIATEAGRHLDGIGVEDGHRSRVTAVAVSALPLRDSGDVDLRALERLPVLDDASVAGWERELRGRFDGRTAAVVVRPVRRTRKFLHLDEVTSRRASGTGDRDDSVSEPTPNELRDAVSAADTVSVPDTGRAWTDGGPRPVNSAGAKTLQDAFRRTMREHPDTGLTFVLDSLEEERLTYPEFEYEARRVAGGLGAAGLSTGDRAMLQFRSPRDFLVAFWGCVLSGVVPVPVGVAPTYSEPNASSDKLLAAWRMLGRPRVLARAALAAEIEGLAERNGAAELRVEPLETLRDSEPRAEWHEAAAGDVAVIMLTSGSTGVPKGVKLTHANVIARSEGSKRANAFSSEEVSLNWMPLDHVAALLFFHLRDIYLGCEQVHTPTELILADPLRWMDLLDRYRATVTFAPNFAFGLVNEKGAEIESRSWDLSCVRWVLNGAESIVPRTARAFLSHLIPHGLPATAMVPAWGMSEVSSGVTYSREFSLDTVDDTDSFVSVGRPIPGVEMRIVDDEDACVSEGVIGHLHVRGTTLMAGYFDESLNAEAFTEDGWFRTGDLAFLRDGALTITGRAKDVIIINSVNYYSHEIEAAVEEVRGVRRSFAAACGVRLEGENTDRLAIFFSPTSDLADDELRALVAEIRRRCLRKVGVGPDIVLPVEPTRIPKTEIGKIQRPLLATRFSEGAFTDVRRRMEVLVGGDRTIPGWFFGRRWVPSEHRLERPDGGRGAIVAVVGPGSTGRATARALASEGVELVMIEAAGIGTDGTDGTGAADGDEATRGRSIVRSVDFRDLEVVERAVSEIVSSTGEIEAWIDLRAVHARPADRVPENPGGGPWNEFTGLLHLVQALARVGASGAPPARLLVGATASAAVRREDPLSPQRAAMGAFLASAAQELPGLELRWVDVGRSEPNELARALLAELAGSKPEPRIAFRDGRRWVLRLEEDGLEGPEDGVEIPQGARLLVTGGLGGLGYELTRFLLERFQAKVLLVGRTELNEAVGRLGKERDEDPDHGADRAGALGRLQALGAVDYLAVDVSDGDALARVVAHAEAAWDGPLDGIFHLAGVYHERSILDESSESIREALRPKVDGGENLVALAQSRPQTFVIGFSSAIGYFGGAMVSGYAAANAGLDAVLERAAAGAPGRYASVGWSTWKDVGISREFAGDASVLRSRGYDLVGLPKGLASLVGALRRGRPILYVGLDGTSVAVRRHLNTGDCGLEEAVVAVGSPGPSETPNMEDAVALSDRFGTSTRIAVEPRDRLPLDGAGEVDRTALAAELGRPGGSAASGPGPRGELERTIVEVLREVLRTERVGVDDNFFDLGGTSLLMAQARAAISARLETKLGRDVTLTELFQFPTVRSLAHRLRQDADTAPEELESSRDVGADRRRRLRAIRGRGPR